MGELVKEGDDSIDSDGMRLISSPRQADGGGASVKPLRGIPEEYLETYCTVTIVSLI